MAGLIDVSESDTLSAIGLFTELSDVSPNLEGSSWQAELDSMDIARSAHIESIAEEDERMGVPQPYADGIKHRPGELEGSSDHISITPMPARRASGDHRLSEIIGFIRRKETWDIKPQDAKLLLMSRLEGGAAMHVPSQKHAKWVNKSEPHVFFVENDTQDACDIEECDRQLISTSGADSHTVTQVDDFIAVTRASSSSGKDSPYPKKVGQWQLALLKGHLDYGSDVFRGIQLKEAKQIGREKIWCRIFGPKLVHSVPDMNKRRRVGAGSSSDAGSSSA